MVELNDILIGAVMPGIFGVIAGTSFFTHVLQSPWITIDSMPEMNNLTVKVQNIGLG